MKKLLSMVCVFFWGLPTQAMSNPASSYCEDNGGTSRIITDGEGNQSAICVFLDGSECEEWSFYNGTCGTDANVNSKNSVNNMLEFIKYASDYLLSHYENPGILQSVSFRTFSNMNLYNMTTKNCRGLFKDDNVYTNNAKEKGEYILVSIKCTTNEISGTTGVSATTGIASSASNKD